MGVDEAWSRVSVIGRLGEEENDLLRPGTKEWKKCLNGVDEAWGSKVGVIGRLDKGEGLLRPGTKEWRKCLNPMVVDEAIDEAWESRAGVIGRLGEEVKRSLWPGMCGESEYN